MYIPDQGDIAWLDFHPSSGKEIVKRRPAFIISRKIFNKHTGLAIVAPITSTIHGIQLEVVLPEKMETKGAVLVHQLKSLDYVERHMKFIEKMPKDLTEKVIELVQLIMR